jgi:hypothetical protein
MLVGKKVLRSRVLLTRRSSAGVENFYIYKFDKKSMYRSRSTRFRRFRKFSRWQLTLVALTTLLGFYWLFQGVLSLVQVFVDRSIPWIWSLLTGIVGILAGLFVLRHPLIAALTVPTLIVIILGARSRQAVLFPAAKP